MLSYNIKAKELHLDMSIYYQRIVACFTFLDSFRGFLELRISHALPEGRLKYVNYLFTSCAFFNYH